MKFISGAGFVFFVMQLIFIAKGRPLQWEASIGFFLYFFALVVFWWAVTATRGARLNLAFTTTQPNKLLTQGPYRYLRHPFYSSYFAFWTAGLLVSSEPVLLLSLICMGLFYIFAIRQEEREFRQSSLRQQYEHYALVTGRLLPRVIRRFNHFDAFVFAIFLTAWWR